MLSFSLVAEALTGLIYHRSSGENPSILLPIQHDGRAGMQRATLGKSGSEAAVAVARSDSESIFQQQFGEYHGYDGIDIFGQQHNC